MLLKVSQYFKNQLWLTYALLVFEFTCQALSPWLLGQAIDALIKGEKESFFLYIVCSIFGLIVGVTRRLYDTRVFSGILRDVSVDTICRMLVSNICPTKISVRVNRISKFTSFYEFNLPQYFKSAIQIMVASCILFLNLHYFTCIIAFIMTISLICSYKISQKIEKVAQEMQKEDEIKQENLINKADFSKTKQSIFDLQKLEVKRSDLDAVSWGIFDICFILCELITIYILATKNVTVGQITSSLMYVNTFTGHFSVFAHAFTTFKDLKVAGTSLEQDNII